MWNRGISRRTKTLDVNFKIYTSENAGTMWTEIWAQSQETAVGIPTPVESVRLYKEPLVLIDSRGDSSLEKYFQHVKYVRHLLSDTLLSFLHVF